MTEEIIVDGVDVAGCNEFLEPDGCDSADCASFQCDRNPNCYYKQLKRLEQENKELKEKIIELSEEKGHLIVENYTLKESNQSLSMLGVDLASANETIRKEFFRADKNKDMWRETAGKYRSALEEIRDYCNRIEQGSVIGTQDCLINSIKNIANEVLENKENNND